MPDTFSMKIEGLDELMRNVSVTGVKVDGMMKKAMVAATTLVQNEARRPDAGRFKSQTGNLRRRIFKGNISATHGEVYTDVPYASYVESGTGVFAGRSPYTITAKNKRVLANRKLGIIFGKTVTRQGNKPYPFMEPALLSNMDNIHTIYKGLAQWIANELVK